MKKTPATRSTVIALLFMCASLHIWAQPDCKRPEKTTSSAVINSFVNTCFDIYDNEKIIVNKLASMKSAGAGDLVNKLDECVSGLKNIQKQAETLVESGTGMFDAAKGLSVFEYVKAFKNITNALKVIKYSLSNAKTLYDEVTGKTGLNTAQPARADSTATPRKQSNPAPAVSAPANERKTSITIKNIKYSDLQVIRDFLNGCTGIKNIPVKFDQQVARIQITHTASAEDIWKQLNAKFPVLLSENNLTAIDEETGVISLALK